MPTPILRFLIVAGALLSAVAMRAQLAAASPFMPPASAHGANTPTADAPLEFRGVAELPDGPAFRVVDSARKKGAWVKLNERDADLGFTVKQHDAARDTVTVEQGGRTFTLALHQSKVASAGAAMPNAVMAPPPMQMGVPTVAAVAQPPAAPLQQSQIDAVAAAVAQRRALRDQAAQQINQGVPVAPAVIQQQQQQRAQGAANQNQNGQNAQNANNPNRQNGQKRNRQD